MMRRGKSRPERRAAFRDQPHVVMGAQPVLDAAGIADRCDVISGDFLAAVPTGGDAYVLKMILHDWDDAECVRILRVCRQAMVVGVALLVVEQDLSPPNASPAPKFLDLNMLVMTGGAKAKRRGV